MAKRKGLSYEQKMLNALKKLPNPLEDKKHNLFIYFDDDRARSNRSRFGHIAELRHGLLPCDIDRTLKHINDSKLKKDKRRTDTFNLFIKRNSYNDKYIQISLEIEDLNLKIAFVKTIFITKIYKI